MLIHGNQFDANLQVLALAEAANAEEKKEAERTRERLRKAASAQAGELDDAADCVVQLSGNDASQGQGEESQSEPKPDEDGGEVFSDWA